MPLLLSIPFYLLLLTGCSITRNVTESNIGQTCAQISNIEIGNAVPRKSILLSGTIIANTGDPKPLIIHDTNITVGTSLFLTDSTITNHTSVLYQPKMIATGNLAFAVTNYFLLGGSYAQSIGTPSNMPKDFKKYLNKINREFSFFSRFNSYSEPLSFSWKPELLFGNVAGEKYQKIDTLLDSSQVDLDFVSIANTFVLRYQFGKYVGLYGGLNLVSLPYSISGNTLKKTYYFNFYTGLDIKLFHQFSTSIYLINPTSSPDIDHNFPMQFGLKLEWQWFFRKYKEATP
jgi:hypothetical protein